MAELSDGEVGSTKYVTKYLDYEAGVRLMKEAGADPDKDTMWDYCAPRDIEVQRSFPTRDEALEWAAEVSKLDVFNTPKISEMKLAEVYDEDRRRRLPRWQETECWQVEGADLVEIDLSF